MLPTMTLVLPTVLIAAALAAFPGGDDEATPGTWNFRKTDKPVKVTLLAGSVGAYAKGNYAKRLATVCKNVELKNISKTGLGAWPLKQHFKKQVLENRYLNVRSRDDEQWLIIHSGLNSIGTPKATNHHLKNIVVHAKRAGMKVVMLSPTPWGSAKSSNFKGLDGLQRRNATQLVTDFIMGKLTATEALGAYADKRPDGAEADWVDLETPDVRVDLYDSALRDTEVETRDVEAMRALLLKDRKWRDSHAAMDEDLREAWLTSDAIRAAEVPQWFMKPELRAFDHIHPNSDGHLIIAETVCPSAPESWGCDCAALAATSE